MNYMWHKILWFLLTIEFVYLDDLIQKAKVLIN
jgi:hypothetical protein